MMPEGDRGKGGEVRRVQSVLGWRKEARRGESLGKTEGGVGKRAEGGGGR